VGFYTELDFMNEGRNQQKLKDLMIQEKVQGVYIPEVYHELSTRRLLVTEWIDGIKLSECEGDEVRELTALGQEAFLVQLLQVGFFHSDPHPGNLLKMNDLSKGRLAIIDFGLVATIKQEEIDTMVNSIVHLANKDYTSLVDDFIALKILPADCDRSLVEPLMDKALSPYVKGGGAKRYEAELKKIYGFDESGAVGGFQAMTTDMLTVMNDIPFSIPPYFALLARAVVTLEGIALTANPDYRLVMEAYPFVARKLLREDRPEVQKALQEVLYAGGGEGKLTPARLAVLLNSAMGVVANTEGSAFVDFDSVPEDGVSLAAALQYVLSPQAASLRGILEQEALTAADLLLRQAARKAFQRASASLPSNPFAFLPLPPLTELPLPLLLPTSLAGEGDQVPTLVPVLASAASLLEAAAPKLSREEEVYALTLKDLVKGLAGDDVAAVAAGDALQEPETLGRLVLAALASGRAPGLDNPQLKELAQSLRGQLLPAEATATSGESEKALAEVTAAVAGLSQAEAETLSSLGSNLVTALAERLVRRLHPLLPPGSPLPPPPVKAKKAAAAVAVKPSSSSGHEPSLTTSAVQVQAAADGADPAARKDVDMPIMPIMESAPQLKLASRQSK
jgi:aarF domain-containing kinase